MKDILNIEKQFEPVDYRSKMTVKNQIKKDTFYIYGFIPEPYVKMKHIMPEIDMVVRNAERNIDYKFQEKDNLFLENEELIKSHIPQIIKPEVVDLEVDELEPNFFETSKKNCFGSVIRFYKDGVIIYHSGKRKKLFDLTIPMLGNNFLDEENSNDFYFSSICCNGRSYFLEHWNTKHFCSLKDNLKIYVACAELPNNKALLFEFKNNEKFKEWAEYVDKKHEKYFESLSPMISGMLIENLPDEYRDNVFFSSAGVIEQLKDLENFTRNFEDIDSVKKVHSPTGRKTIPSKKELLITGYNDLIFSTFNALFVSILQLCKDHSDKKINLEEQKEVYEANKVFFDGFLNSKNLTTKDLVKSIIEQSLSERSKEDIGSMIRTLRTSSNISVDRSMYSLAKSLMLMYQLWILLNLTKKGTALPMVGDIEYYNFSDKECLYYWPNMNGCLLASGWMEKDSAFKVLDTQSLYENFTSHLSASYKAANKTIISEENFKTIDDTNLEYINKIATEIEEQGTGEYIPYNAAFEIKDDPNFKYVRFVENDRNIMFFVTDENDNVIADVYNKRRKEFCGWILNTQKINEEQERSFCNYLYPKIMAAIRDWKILIERDSTMLYRGKRIPNGVVSNKKRYIYLPRVRYKRNPEKERIFYSENKKLSGERRAHVRKLPSGTKASKLQLLLAANNNIPVQDGYTFVRESIWGKGMTKTKKIFRTRSLHGEVYVDPDQVEKAKEINDLSPAGFEEYVSKYLEKQGWEIIERQNYDGGIDVRGFKEIDGVIKKAIVQCKHWKKPIGPDVVRELIGAKEVENDEYEKIMMVITSSRFTTGAIEIAEKHNVILIDGDHFLNEVE